MLEHGAIMARTRPPGNRLAIRHPPAAMTLAALTGPRGDSSPVTGHLSSLERENVCLLNVLLVGQNELNTIVGERQNHDLGRRIAARHRIDPLTATEAGEYIGHRLKVAGAERNPFGWEAILQIGALSRGVPRVINMIADLALLSGSRHKADTITSDMVTECARDLGLVPGDEPFTRYFSQGQILGPDGRRMSKSRGNVVAPDDQVERWGADAFRAYLKGLKL